MAETVILVVALVSVLIFFALLVVFFFTIRLWIQAMLCQVPLSIGDIIGMKIRRTPADLIVGTAIALKLRKIDVPIAEIESCYLAYGEGVTTRIELATLVLEQRNKATDRTT